MMILEWLLLAAAAAQLPAPACPIDRAAYRLNGAPGFTAGFARQDRRKAHASDLALWLKTPRRTYWFSFGSPNGYGGTYIAPDTDPRRSSAAAEPTQLPDPPAGEEPLVIHFDAFGRDLKAFASPPQSSDRPPALLFSRGLGPALWYNWVALAGGDEKAQQESMPTGLFEAAGCSGPPR